VKARQNPLAKFEAFMQRMVETPFARMFPSRLEPAELTRKLERAMEDNILIQIEGRRLAPNVYDIYLSRKDHQQLSPSQASLIRDWRNHLVEFARHRHYTLRSEPVIRLHADTGLGPGQVRIEAEQADRSSGEGGLMATQELSAEQLAQMRAQMQSGQQIPGVPNIPSSSPSQPGFSSFNAPPMSRNPSKPLMQPAVALPPARLTIRLPQGGQQVFRIEKPIINIGRQLSNDIIVEDKRVSRYHAQIKFQPDGQFAIFDLGSTNGITINGTPNLRQHILRTGDRFTIGSYDFYFERR
jgi:Protein of unknown function (DUF3662)/FHA domain